MKNSKFIEWVKKNAPKALKTVGDITGVDALSNLAKVIKNDNPDELTPDQQREANEVYLKELEIIVSDRDSARNRQVKFKVAGGNDFLMNASGVVALLTFCTVIYASIWQRELTSDNPTFHQITGMIEGVTLTIYAFYFGTSKKEQEK